MPRLDLSKLTAAKGAAGAIKAMKGAGWSWAAAAAPPAPIYGRAVSIDLRWTTAIPADYAMGIVPRPRWVQVGAGAFPSRANYTDNTGAGSGISSVGAGAVSNQVAGVGLNDGTQEANLFYAAFTMPPGFSFGLTGIPYAKYDLFAYITARNANVQSVSFDFAGERINYNAACPGWTGAYIEGVGGNTLARRGLSGPSQSLAALGASDLLIGGFQLVERLD